MRTVKHLPTTLPVQTNLFDYRVFLREKLFPFSYIPYFTKHLKIKIHQGLIVLENDVKAKSLFDPPERTSNDIRCFSYNSRLRMQKLLAKINFSSYGPPIFLTTTFHNIYSSDKMLLKKLLDNYIKSALRIKYKFHYIWRLEFQKRGAPHFHFILLPFTNLDTNQKKSFQRSLKKKWLHFLKDNSLFTNLYSTKFIDIENTKSVSAYLSKYMAKTDNQLKENSPGRFWGYSRKIEISPIFSLDLSRKSYAIIKKILSNYLKTKIKVNDYLLENFDTLSSLSIFLTISTLKTLFLENLFDKYYNIEIEQIKLFLFCK